MEVEHRLASIRPDVRDHPVAALEAGLGGEGPDRAEEARQQVAVGIGQVLRVGDVAARDDEDVRRCAAG